MAETQSEGRCSRDKLNNGCFNKQQREENLPETGLCSDKQCCTQGYSHYYANLEGLIR